MGISTYSTTAASNTALFPEGMNPSDVNDSARQVQADIRSWFEDASWTDLGHTPTYVSASSFTVTGDQTSIYTANRRVKCYGSTMGTLRGYISSSSYSSNTTVNVTLDSGSLTSNLSQVYVSVLDPSDNAVPESLAIVSLAADRVSVSGTANLGILAIAKNLTTTATAVLNSVQVSNTAAIGGNVSIGGTLTLTGAADFNGSLDLSGTANITAMQTNPTIAGKKALLATLSNDYAATAQASDIHLDTGQTATVICTLDLGSADANTKILIGGQGYMFLFHGAGGDFNHRGGIRIEPSSLNSVSMKYGSTGFSAGNAICQDINSYHYTALPSGGLPGYGQLNAFGMVDCSGSGSCIIQMVATNYGNSASASVFGPSTLWAMKIKN